MPMMRRGPLDRYPPEWVLRQANAHQAEGSIEFHTDRPVTLYLQGGRAYAAEEGVNLLEHDLTARHVTEEGDARTQAIRLISEVMPVRTGWYFHDPLGQHPSRGSWTWETATLLMETRGKVHETTALPTWAGRTVVLHQTTAESVTLGTDAWALVVRLTGSVSATDLRAQLGWSPDRIAAALAEIEDQGVLEPAPPAPAPTGPTGPGGHHTGPLAPPPSPPAPEPADALSLRRRMLPTRRTSGS